VLQGIQRRHDVEGFFNEGQFFHLALEERGARCAASGEIEHGTAGVQAHHAGPQVRRGFAEKARTTAYVQ